MNHTVDGDPDDYSIEPDDRITADFILRLWDNMEIMSVHMDAVGEESHRVAYQDTIDGLDDQAKAVKAALAAVVADQGYDYCPYVYI